MDDDQASRAVKVEPRQSPFRVGEWTAEPAWNRVHRDGDTLKLEPRVMRLLATLAAAPGRPLSRQQLLELVWPDVLVNEEALSRAVSQLRRALGDEPRAPRFIETVHKGGYCLIAPVSDGPAQPVSELKQVPEKTLLRLIWPLVVILAAAIAAAMFYSGQSRSRASESRKLLVPLTSEPGREIDPAVSPDGARVVYLASGTSGYDLFVRGIEDAGPVRLTSNPLSKGHPVWSPDGKRIAFVAAKGDAAAIYLVRSTGGTAAKIVDLPSWSFGLDWSPDGRTLAYSDATPGETPRIVLLDLASKAVRPIAISGESSGDVKPVFSPDGRRVAFIRNDPLGGQQIAIADLRGDAEAGVLRMAPQQLRGIDWAPGGKSLIYSARSGRRFGLWRIAADGSKAPEPLAVEGGDLFNPSVAHNGRVIVEDVEQDRDIWRTALAGGDAKALIRSTFDDHEPAYAPDGTLAFVSERSGTSEIWLRSASGAERRLTNLGEPEISRLTWSPDGERLAFRAEQHGVAAIHAVTRNGKIDRLLRTSQGRVPIGWSAGRERLFLLAPKERQWHLEELTLGTGRSRRITPLPVAAAAVAGDGRSIFAVASGESRLLRILPGGGMTRQFRLAPGVGDVSALLPAGRFVHLLVEKHGTAAVHRLNLDTAVTGRATHIENFGGGKATLSPDGRFLTYTQARETANDLAWLWL